MIVVLTLTLLMVEQHIIHFNNWGGIPCLCKGCKIANCIHFVIFEGKEKKE